MILGQKLWVKGVLHPDSEISMFCALFQNYQRLFGKMLYASYS